MEPELIPQLIAEIALADPRVRRDDKIERRAQAKMWAGILAEVPYPYAVHAAQQHYARSQFPILPADIASRWQSVVRDRMARDVDPLPAVDPDNGAAYRAAVVAHRRAVVAGQTAPVEAPQLTASPAAAEAKARLERLGTYLPPHLREGLAAHRPGRAERERLATEGLTDPLDVACPVESCRAYVGRPCTRPGRGGARHALTSGSHPSRTEAAEQAARAVV
ncbi:zinc finger domain-containing protein [Streptomyces sp. NBC_00306]|uniref:zinc finger domain-containing protein n=1 Tax=Streptomyces sp. NBC_00306 TaxID=2975708 RepID=UPI002E2992DE|nr:cell surface glycoprotein [Streptomyces sp. NBC_00306]